MADFNPIQVLLEELQDDDLQMRLNAVKRISTIALALGEQRSRDELIPFIAENLPEEDELRLAIAEALVEFVPLVGGKAFAHVIIEPLQELASVDEVVVREKAVETMVKISTEMEQSKVESHFVAAIGKLTEDSFFAPRASACGLYPTAYGRVSAAMQAKLLAAFKKLCHDETPMVRRAAASALKDLVGLTTPDVATNTLLPALSLLMKDNHDSVRVLAIHSLKGFAKVLPADEVGAALIPLLHAGAKDSSWKVRKAVGESLKALEEVVSPALVKSELVVILTRLLKDPEAEVKSLGVSIVPDFGNTLSNADRELVVITNILPALSEACGDSNQYARVAVASALPSICPVLGKAKTLEHVVPLLLKLLQDDFSDVRLGVISQLSKLQPVIGSDQVLGVIVPQIVAIAEDPQWRVRLAIIEQLESFGKILGASKFDSKLLPVAMSWLVDGVYAVREAMIAQLPKLIKLFGNSWTKSSLIPKIVSLGSESVYVARLTTLFVINAVVDVVDKSLVQKNFVPLVLKMSGDAVPNVRFNVARTLGLLLKKVSSTSNIVSQLEALKSDPDEDVQYYATQALK